MPNAARQRRPDRRPVSFVFGGSIESPEHADQEIRLQRGLRPVHPAVDNSANRRIARPEMSGAMTRGQIAKNGVRFPNRRITVLNDGYTAMGIHRQESRRIEPAEPAAGVDMLVFKP